MSHKIVIMSPLHNMGASVISALIAQGATFNNKTSNLIFTQQGSNLPAYLGVNNLFDPTRSIMQIVKLIDNGAIDDKDITDYAHQYSPNAYLLNVADPSLTGRDREQVITHIFNRVSTDLSICDNSEDIDSPLTQKLLEIADMVFIVVDMSKKAQDHLKAWLDTPQLKNKGHVYFIVSKYNEVVYSVRNYAKVIAQPANRVCKMHYNPWIEKCCNNHQLHNVLPLARVLDPRVAALNVDIAELMQCIGSNIIFTMKKGF